MQELKHWRLEREPAGLAWLIFDKAGESTNTLSAAAMHELGLVLDELEREPPKALVIRSGKSAGFIAGADIEEFTRSVRPKMRAHSSSAAGTCTTASLRCNIRPWR